MDEHDDDLESAVDEGAEEEIDDFPATGDKLDDSELGDDDGDLDLDEDKSEL
jgi:hypothetical protein